LILLNKYFSNRHEDYEVNVSESYKHGDFKYKNGVHHYKPLEVKPKPKEFGRYIYYCPSCKSELESYRECKLCGWQKYPKKIEKMRSRTIPKSVQREVWRRDRGRCVECESKERLEFDHIIPFSKGGSNTARNIQLLCEKCNRSKGKNL